MAAKTNTKEIVITAKLDTTDSVSKVMQLQREVKKIDASQPAQSLELLNQRMQAGNMTVREMTQLMKQYQTIAANAGMTSPIGQEALKRAGELKDKIGDIKEATTALAADGRRMQMSMQITNATLSGYNAFIGITQLAGGENKKLLETMSKMMIIQQTLNSVEQLSALFRRQSLIMIQAQSIAYKVLGVNIETATTATRIFSKALIATGIGAIIALIGMLIANFKEITNWIGNIIEKAKNIPVIGTAVKGLTMAFEALGKVIQWVKELFGGLTEEQEKQLELNKKRIADIENLIAALEKQAEREKKIAEAKGQDTYEIEKKYAHKKINLLREELNAHIANQKIKKNLDEVTAKKALEQAEKLKDLMTEFNAMEIKQEREKQEEINKAREEAAKRYIERIKKERDEFAEWLKNVKDLETINMFESIDQELAAMEQRNTAILESISQRSTSAIDIYSTNLDKFFKKNQEQAKTLEIVKQSAFSFATSMGSVFQSLSQLAAKNSAAQKKWALAGIIVNQAEAIANAVVAATKAAKDITYDPTGIGRTAVFISTFATITASILSGIVQAKQLLGEAGGAESVSMPHGGTGGGVGSTSTQQNESAVMYKSEPQQQGITKVVVVESDITKVQQNAKYINKISVL